MNKIKNFFNKHSNNITKGIAIVGSIIAVSFMIFVGRRKEAINVYELNGVIRED